MILQKEHFANPISSAISSTGEGTIFIISSARLSSIPPVQWSKEFLKMVREAGRADKDYREAAKQAKEPLMVEDSILYQKMKLWVPKDLRATVLESEHDSKIAGHFGQDKTIELIRRNFWWPKMDEIIIDYIQSCPECQKDKAAWHQKYGLLQPLELPYAPW
jgi:hypothetical protein